MPMPGFHAPSSFPMSGSGDGQPLAGNVGYPSSSDVTSTPPSVGVPGFFNQPKPLTMPFKAPDGSHSLFQQRPLVSPAGINARSPLVVPGSIRPQGAINVVGNVISENKAPGSPIGSQLENPRSFAPPPGLVPKQTTTQGPQHSQSSFEKLVSVLRRVYLSYSRQV